MTTSPDFGLPLIAGQQAQPEVTHNEAVRLLQALANGVISRGVNSPPGGPNDGDAYIVGSAPTGAWAGRANAIAVYAGTGWLFVPGDDDNGTPIVPGARQEGMRVWVRDEDAFYLWTQAGSPPAFAWINPTGLTMPIVQSTFTPTVSFLNPGDLSVTYFVQDGVSLRINDFVMITINIDFTPTYTTATGNFLIQGYPVPIAVDGLGSFIFAAGGSYSGVTYPAGTTSLVAHPTSGTAAVLIRAMGSGVLSTLTHTHVPSGQRQLFRLESFYQAS